MDLEIMKNDGPGIEMQRNSKPGVKIISECKGLIKRQVIGSRREEESRIAFNSMHFKGVRCLEEGGKRKCLEE